MKIWKIPEADSAPSNIGDFEQVNAGSVVEQNLLGPDH